MATGSNVHQLPQGNRTGNNKLGVWRRDKTLGNMAQERKPEEATKTPRNDNYSQQRNSHAIYDLLNLKTTRRKSSSAMENILKRDVQFNPNARDTTGNSPLLLAVKNDHPEVVDRLLNRASHGLMKEALLLSISLDHHHISESIIRHPTYSAIPTDAQGTMTSQVSETTLDVTTDDTLFTADITPLVLAAQRDQFDIVKLLISMGECIEEPHNFNCKCPSCRWAPTFDELRSANTRLSINKGLASEAYISLSSPDPFLTAFRLGRIFRRNAKVEKYFKGEYKRLITQLGDYTLKLLDKVRDGKELDILLNESRGTPFSDLGKMARLKLAIRFEEKRFVAHASCQKMITHAWYGRVTTLQHMATVTKVLWVCGFSLLYPILAFFFWVYPYEQVGKFLSTPVIKYLADALSHVALVVLIILFSAKEYASEGLRISERGGLNSSYAEYVQKCNETGTDPVIGDVYLRSDDFGIVAYVFAAFVLGYVWQILKNISLEKIHFVTDNWFNTFDVILFGLYTSSLVLRAVTVFKVYDAIDNLSSSSNWDDMRTDDGGYLYWLDADRHSWREWDLFTVSEAMFAVANVMCITRTASMLTASEIIGPLIIALKQMIKNVLMFMCIFVIVICAFIVGFNSLYWYYDSKYRKTAESAIYLKPDHATNAEAHFGEIIKICRTMFFTLFGMIDADAVRVGKGYQDFVTTNVGYLMLGAYNWICIIVLINMLIAMMARSYLFIEAEKDAEWKFSRTKLYLEYIKEGNVLCVPFNLIPSVLGLVELIKDIGTCCGCRNPSDTERTKAEKQQQKQQMKFRNQSFEVIDETTDAHDNELEGVTKQGDEDNTDEATNGHYVDKSKLPEHYRKVIEKIIKRFIAHSSTKKEASSGVVDDSSSVLAVIKRDMSNFRYQMIQALKGEQGEKMAVNNTVASLGAMLKDTNEHVEEVAATSSRLEQALLKDIPQQLTETNARLTETNARLSAMEEKFKYSREDARNYETNIDLKLVEIQDKFSSEMTKLNPTLVAMEASLRLMASELTNAKSTVATLSHQQERILRLGVQDDIGQLMDQHD